MALPQILEMTASYSNAVMVAVMPHLNEFSQKAELPVPLPITSNSVEKLVVNPFKETLACGVTLTNNCRFLFDNGYVNSFSQLGGNPFLSDQPSVDWPHYVGNAVMNTNDAVEMARNTLKKLGYNLHDLYVDIPPTSFEGPYDIREGFFPYCQIRWEREAQSPEDLTNAVTVTFQIDMKEKKIMGIDIFSRKAQKLSTKKGHVKKTLLINTNAPNKFLKDTSSSNQ